MSPKILDVERIATAGRVFAQNQCPATPAVVGRQCIKNHLLDGVGFGEAHALSPLK